MPNWLVSGPIDLLETHALLAGALALFAVLSGLTGRVSWDRVGWAGRLGRSRTRGLSRPVVAGRAPSAPWVG